MFATLQLGKSEISIVLTDDNQIQHLNKIYRHLDRPTDVLAFAMCEGEAARFHAHILGDVVVSVDTARTQASRAKRRVLSEVTMLLAHGILHLLGWDHETSVKDRRMRLETERLCKAASRSQFRQNAGSWSVVGSRPRIEARSFGSKARKVRSTSPGKSRDGRGAGRVPRAR
jgi:probable rRNA maturation factor